MGEMKGGDESLLALQDVVLLLCGASQSLEESITERCCSRCRDLSHLKAPLRCTLYASYNLHFPLFIGNDDMMTLAKERV